MWRHGDFLWILRQVQDFSVSFMHLKLQHITVAIKLSIFLQVVLVMLVKHSWFVNNGLISVFMSFLNSISSGSSAQMNSINFLWLPVVLWRWVWLNHIFKDLPGITSADELMNEGFFLVIFSWTVLYHLLLSFIHAVFIQFLRKLPKKNYKR